jgi:hypothetical protein
MEISQWQHGTTDAKRNGRRRSGMEINQVWKLEFSLYVQKECVQGEEQVR